MADCKTRISLIPLPQFQADKGPLPDGMLSARAGFFSRAHSREGPTIPPQGVSTP